MQFLLHLLRTSSGVAINPTQPGAPDAHWSSIGIELVEFLSAVVNNGTELWSLSAGRVDRYVGTDHHHHSLAPPPRAPLALGRAGRGAGAEVTCVT